MNALRGLRCCLLALTIAPAACSRTRIPEMDGNHNQPQYFATSQEVVAKARHDLLEVLRVRRDLNLGVDSATLSRSQPAPPIRRVDLSFERLLGAAPSDSFGALVQADRTTVVPLVAGNRVVTIVEVVHEPRGWRVSGLAGRDIADDLTTVRRASGDSATVTTLYEVPNLQARVYGVGTGPAERLYTSYGGRFNLRQGLTSEVLIPALRADAIEFQRRFGDSLKTHRLVR